MTEEEKKVSEEVENETTETAEEQTVPEQETEQPLSETEILTQKNEDLKQQVNELKDKYTRLNADFDNFRRRMAKERLEAKTSITKGVIAEFLEVADDFDRAKANADDESNEEVFSEGVNIVFNKFFKILESRGVKAMESNGADFDTDFHEAITKIPAGDESMKGKVIDTIQKGYFLNESIIRHAKVVVGE